MDRELPPLMKKFHYCSPHCRDLDLLNTASKRTKMKVEELERKLHGAVNDSSMQTVSQHITKSPGPCTRCSEMGKLHSEVEKKKTDYPLGPSEGMIVLYVIHM